MNSQEKRQLFNIILLGLAFLFIFGAFQTSAMFQTTVLNAAKQEVNSTFTGNGYWSLAIIYITFAFANWLAPIIVVWLKPKYSMFLSSIIYALFSATFIHPMNWSLYLGSFLLGLSAAVLWTGQGNFLSLNSNSKTTGRNTTIFWALFQSSLIFGNIFQYVLFRDVGTIKDKERVIMYSVFTGCGIFGSLLVLILQRPVNVTELEIISSEGDLYSIPSDTDLLQYHTNYTPLEAFFQSFRLIKTKSMLLLMIVFAYTGFELTFFSGIYGTCVGHTKYFGEKAKGYIGLIGIAIGLGEITSTLLFTGISKVWKKITPDIVVIIGLIIHVLCFYLIFLSLPFDSTLNDSLAETYITPRPGVIIFCGYLLGFGDSIFNTQVMSLLADSYKGIDSPSAFALFKFMQSLTSAIGFFYSTYLTLQWQLLILCITAVMGTITFVVAENQNRAMLLERNEDLSITD